VSPLPLLCLATHVEAYADIQHSISTCTSPSTFSLRKAPISCPHNGSTRRSIWPLRRSCLISIDWPACVVLSPPPPLIADFCFNRSRQSFSRYSSSPSAYIRSIRCACSTTAGPCSFSTPHSMPCYDGGGEPGACSSGEWCRLHGLAWLCFLSFPALALASLLAPYLRQTAPPRAPRLNAASRSGAAPQHD
jgi:hypothetical protein